MCDNGFLWARRMTWCGVSIALIGGFALAPRWAGATPDEAPPPQGVSTTAIEELADIMVEAPEPRYVSPTRRDQIGRIWAPVMINGHGPFRLVLDTGASHSAVTSLVALALGIPTDQSQPVMLRGVTGFATVPTIHVDSLTVGDLSVDSPMLPIVPDALGGAQGILGAEGLQGKRIYIDFHHDKISITFSRNEKSPRDFVNVPFHAIRSTLVVVDVVIGDVHTKAIIDTGGQTTIANLALRNALIKTQPIFRGKPDQIEGATKDIQNGDMYSMPAIHLGGVEINDSAVTFVDAYIFKQWKLTNQPAILIGMDALGLLDTLVIDYRRHELQMRMQRPGRPS
jgi:predicted aspartyl protease